MYNYFITSNSCSVYGFEAVGVYADVEQDRLSPCAYKKHMGGFNISMISVAAYHTEYNEEEKVSYVWVDEEIICPNCACATLIKKGWRKRKLILIDDDVSIMKVRRVMCKDCNKIHHVLPDIIVPYKRHELETIEKIAHGCQNETFCEESEINRIKAWWRKLLIYIALLEVSIKSQIPNPLESNLSKAVRVLANAHLWPRTRIALGLG